LDPLTHALSGAVLSRVGLNKATPLALPMLIASSLAADFDWFTSLGGAEAFLRGNRTATHSLAGTAVIAIVIAGIFTLLPRKHPAPPVRFLDALFVCVTGAGVHLLMDLTNSYGVMLLWPFRRTWFAWDLVDTMDVGILAWLLLGLLMPGLFRLITEEIGAKAKRTGPRRGAIFALVMLTLWIGARWGLHDHAIAMLEARNYSSEPPNAVGAFPSAVSPLDWKGVVETDSLVKVLDVPIGHGVFDPMLGESYFKPEPSPVLDEARRSVTVDEFMHFARFPSARVAKTDEGWRFELRDLRFHTWIPGRQVPRVVVELNKEFQIVSETLYFSPAMVR
jgi:inner membrane protein